MKFAGYPHYKNAGESWLGEVPAHWNLERLGLHFRERRTKVSDKDYTPLSVTKNGVVPQLETAAKTDDGDNRKLVKDGDFVINGRSDRKGSSGLSKLNGSVSLINIVLQPESSIYPEFSHYLLRSTAFQEEFYRMGNGLVADLWTTHFSDMKNIRLALPPIAEQCDIAAFLARQTTRIDTLIEKKTKFIELLKEKRQAVITNAVTKGLDPSAPTQKSGVEWIGQIPANWSVRPLFSAAKEVYRSNKGMVESNLLSLSYGKVVRRDINAGEGLLPDSFETYQIIEDGEIVMRLTDLQNDQKSLRTALATERGIVTSAYIVIRPSDSLNSEYLAHLMRAYDIQKVFYSMGGGMRQSMKFSDLRRLPLLIPSLQEQKAICLSLHPKLARIDQLATNTERSIELLREHRSALITAVVTGKIDVRMSK